MKSDNVSRPRTIRINTKLLSKMNISQLHENQNVDNSPINLLISKEKGQLHVQ